ncbi:hypothetical protein E5K00_00875 [Hymenobacter aquaticus]|uniref:PorT family protein n=1 Tax=Hymenobacter aquaticus TaxID=1867101 RepID=A0A4Z0Q1D7_9BACT|nr:hypothetical protein [Hymenobacter aquaticus]TGE23800.1 hypothetical protein E5K00_00875 [Hymenobacter aquaticus]
MIRLYFFLFLLISTAAARAQGLPGFVITTSGDTLPGDVVEKSGQRLLFYPASRQAAQVYRPDQLRGYGLRGHAPILSKVVQLATGADSARFVLLQTPGPASLYSFSNDQGLLLGTAASDTLYELTASNWHVVLNRYLRACPSLRHTDPALMALPFSEADIRRVLVQYNTCVEPQWQPRPRTNYSGWRKGVGVHLAVLRTAQGFFDSQVYAQSREVGLEWTGIRASGLQSGIQLDYIQLNGYSPVIEVAGPRQTVLEERLISRSHVLAPVLTVGKRFGKVRRPNFYLGGGLGFAFLLDGTREIQQRAAGSTTEFQRVSLTRESFGGAVFATVSTGVLLPLSSSQEVRLNATYQRILVGSVNSFGAQLAYYWLLK